MTMKQTYVKTLLAAAFSCAQAGVAAVAQVTDGSAATPTTYTLCQCVGEAMAHNLKLRNAHWQTEMAAEQRKEAFTKFFPTVSATGVGYMANRELLQMDMGGMDVAVLKHGTNASLLKIQ